MDVSDVIYIPDIPELPGSVPDLDFRNMQHLTSYVSAPPPRQDRNL